MPLTCIRHTDLPNTSRLFVDFLYEFDRVRPFYSHAPLEADSFAAAAGEIQYPDDRRAALVAALAEINAPGDALDRLARPGTVAVVTGQQVGLYSGPTYTVYKALTAAKLAKRLTESGIAAVPVFWLATEDHDFDEVRVAWTFDNGHQTSSLSLDSTLASGGPVGSIAPSSYPNQALRQTLQDFPHGKEVAALVEECYRPGASLGGAFRELLTRLLSGYGLLVIDPSRPSVRQLARPLIEAALANAPGLTEHLLARNRRLAGLGYHAQVHVEEHTSLVFLLEGGKRVALKRKDDDYFAAARKLTRDDLLSSDLSPNALLRPVVQDAILPTAAYIGGPAELAYLAQAEVLYRELLGRMPVVLPRASFSLTDFRANKLLNRYDLELTDLFHGIDPLRERIARKLVPPELSDSLQQAHHGTMSSIDQLAARLDGFDPSLGAALVKNRQKIQHQLGKIEGKIRREALKRDGRAASDAEWLYNLLFPHKHLQERIYSILPFIARHGPDLIDRIYDQVELGCPDHRVLEI
ncbi:MAG: bacillithiol biosynthesis cysteine-adding enzyme BshC [Bryobacteraceae bacterium]